MQTLDQNESVVDFVQRFSQGEIHVPSADDFLALDDILCITFERLRQQETQILQADRVHLADQEKIEQQYRHWLQGASSLSSKQNVAQTMKKPESWLRLEAKVAECQEILREFEIARKNKAIMKRFFQNEANVAE